MKIILTLFICLFSSPALSDQFYLTVGLECNEKKTELMVWFNGAWNEKGEAAIAALTFNQWNPRDLVSFAQDADGKYTITPTLVKTSCQLKNHHYKIEISPLLAPRFHPEGHCASRIGAVVTILEGEKTLVRKGVDACTESGTVPTLIKINPKHRPSYTEVLAEIFYAN
jgi:hypothetical protein